MQILIATAGALTPEPVADLVARLVEHGGTVYVVSVIEVPYEFLDTIQDEAWRPMLEQGEWSAQDEPLHDRYVEERGRRLVEPVVAALRARGVTAEPIFVEGNDPAGAITASAERLEADLIVLGATRSLFTGTTWESVSEQVIRESRRPVVVMPPPQKVETVEA